MQKRKELYGAIEKPQGKKVFTQWRTPYEYKGFHIQLVNVSTLDDPIGKYGGIARELTNKINPRTKDPIGTVFKTADFHFEKNAAGRELVKYVDAYRRVNPRYTEAINKKLEVVN
jgi:hypothetical protein